MWAEGVYVTVLTYSLSGVAGGDLDDRRYSLFAATSRTGCGRADMRKCEEPCLGLLLPPR